jgi:aminotransferase in exopolysaccharide biosynthesis
VITQSLTFVATCNAIRYCGATPIFVDVDQSSLGLSPLSLETFLEENCELRDDGFCWNKSSNRRIVACLPMHTFGFPVQLDEIKQICDRYNINLVEDGAESLGSLYKGRHTGGVGKISIISFNGNKIITTGGGGMILTNNEELAIRSKHITTTCKVPHRWAFEHDEVGYNYRLPNLNAALGMAQMESLSAYIENKRSLAKQYQEWGDEHGLKFVQEPVNTRSNYWLNVAVTQDKQQRDAMLEITNNNNVMTRPIWIPMHKLAINQDCQKGDLTNTEWLYERLVNVPSSVVPCE